MNKIFIGSHLSLSAPDYYLGVVKTAMEYNETTFMFYTGAPQNAKRLPTNIFKINEARELLKQNNFDESKLVIHAPYIINIANPVNAELREMSISVLKNEIKRTNDFNIKTIVLHPGSHLKTEPIKGIDLLADGLNKIFKSDKSDVKIAIETMSGKGSEIGKTFEEIKLIIDKVENKNRIGVCLDTCHINDAGYNIKDVDFILNEFDRIIGLDKLLVIHLNDSMNEINTHKDRHANIGKGTIGFDTLYKFVHHPRLINIPKILETPYIGDKAPYKEEIYRLLNNIK